MKKRKAIAKINPIFLKGICHRGLHKDQTDENTLSAFKKAKELGKAIEFDIHVTKDLRLVVIHDSDLKRVTGKDGIVEALTFNELRNNYRLLNGEVIPSIEEVFNLIDEVIPMVIELKTYHGNASILAKKTKEALKMIHNKSNVILISFDRTALAHLRHQGYIRQLLISKGNERNLKYSFMFEGLDLDYQMLDNPKVIKYAKKHLLNVWTIDTVEKLKKACKIADMITFQYIAFQDFKKTFEENRKA